MDEILHQHLEIELGQISASPLPPSSMLGVFCHGGGAGFRSFNFFFSDNQTAWCRILVIQLLFFWQPNSAPMLKREYEG